MRNVLFKIANLLGISYALNIISARGIPFGSADPTSQHAYLSILDYSSESNKLASLPAAHQVTFSTGRLVSYFPTKNSREKDGCK